VGQGTCLPGSFANGGVLPLAELELAEELEEGLRRRRLDVEERREDLGQAWPDFLRPLVAVALRLGTPHEVVGEWADR
jgi:hypothetical protein